jgi:hypothetical protein
MASLFLHGNKLKTRDRWSRVLGFGIFLSRLSAANGNRYPEAKIIIAGKKAEGVV